MSLQRLWMSLSGLLWPATVECFKTQIPLCSDHHGDLKNPQYGITTLTCIQHWSPLIRGIWVKRPALGTVGTGPDSPCVRPRSVEPFPQRAVGGSSAGGFQRKEGSVSSLLPMSLLLSRQSNMVAAMLLCLGCCCWSRMETRLRGARSQDGVREAPWVGLLS